MTNKERQAPQSEIRSKHTPSSQLQPEDQESLLFRCCCAHLWTQRLLTHHSTTYLTYKQAPAIA
eukprot:scaffold67454_cov44-Cyclotella_meneghiniana.AAC.1